MAQFSSDHTTSMKLLSTFALLALLTVSSGYAADQLNQTEAPDGFYVGADTAPSYALPIVSNGGDPVTVQIHEDGDFIPKHFSISATDKIPGGYLLKVDGQNANRMTDLPGIVIIANHKAYFGYARRVSSSTRSHCCWVIARKQRRLIPCWRSVLHCRQCPLVCQ